MKRITMATVKSFVRKNANKEIFVNVKSSFDGMIDGVREERNGFSVASRDDGCPENTLGLCGVWLVGSSRDRFSAYEDDNFIGIEYYNCCGNGVIAIAKNNQRMTIELAEVRGAIMNELETRDNKAFDLWIDCMTDDSDYPSKFFK